MSSEAVAIIVGTRSDVLLADLDDRAEIHSPTPYGQCSSKIERGTLHGREILVLYRHGYKHSIAPHKINYRANIWALGQLRPKAVIAINTVGSICSSLKPGDFMLPDQLIDYTWGRESTYFDTDLGHLEFSTPYSSQIRSAVLNAANAEAISVKDGGIYAITQGPRLETPAEIERIERDGGDVVGMTGMPEAALAAELNLCYACINLVVNRAAGRGSQQISFEDIQRALRSGNESLNILIGKTLAELALIEELIPETKVFQ